MNYICSICKEEHEGLPDIGFAKPDLWFDEPREGSGNFLTPDLCIIEDTHYFVRGVIEIPVIGTEETFGWGVWVSHKKENFEIYRENFDTDKIGPFFGWLANTIKYYQRPQESIKTMAHYRSGNRRPRIEVGECDHPLYRHQQEGITVEEVMKISHSYP